MTATLERYMTRYPHTVRIDESLKTAADLMHKLQVRHLPVLDAGKLVGVVSERDLKLAVSAALERKLAVGDVCTEEPYVVDIDTSIDIVAQTMAEKKVGSAIVLEDGRVAGIFTAVDACRALADLVARYERR